jgi:hypothetical protein
MEPEAVLQAVLQVWPELPDLLGSSWPEVRARIRPILDRLRGAGPEEWFSPAAELVLIFQDHPRARTRLEATIREISRLRGQTFRGPEEGTVSPPRQPGSRSLLARLGQLVRGGPEPQPEPLTRYTDISCPRQVSVREPRLSVTVRLRVKRPDGAAKGPPVVGPPGPVEIEVDAADFEVLGPHKQTTAIVPDQDSPPLVFDLKPRSPGETRINFDFYAGTQWLGSATVPVTVTPGDAPGSSSGVSAPATVAVRPGGEPPDYTVTIAYERRESGPALSFTLRRAAGVDRVFPSVPLGEEPLTRSRRLFEQLNNLSAGVSPAAQEVSGRRLPLSPEEISRQLKEVGQNLWRYLVPAEFRAMYVAEQAAWKDRVVFVFSDEPFFPWELLWPHHIPDEPGGYWEDDQPWCLTLHLARWLRRKPDGVGHDTPPTALDLRALVCLAPTDSGLAAAQQELAWLRELAKARGWDDLSPPVPTLEAVKDLLDDGGFDWVHAAAHGSIRAAGAEDAFVLWLQGTMPIGPDAIVGRVAQNVHDRRAGFIFNACHVGREGWSLNRLDGWAQQLLSSGAGVFLAPMWPVSDVRALDFSRALYMELLAGRTIAEAVRQARLAARRDGDPSWLAYSLYAHPNARLVPAAGEPSGGAPAPAPPAKSPG